jgi:hypothetical protein
VEGEEMDVNADSSIELSEFLEVMARNLRAAAAHGDWAFAVIKPYDPHSGLSAAVSLTTSTRHVYLFSLVCLPLDDGSGGGGGGGINRRRLSAVQATATGDSLKEFVEVCMMPYVAQSTASAIGKHNQMKMDIGAPVVVSFDIDFATSGLLSGEQVLGYVGDAGQESQEAMNDGNANLMQNHGFLWEESEEYVHVEILRATASEYSTYQAPDNARQYFQTEPAEGVPYGGHYLKICKDRVLAHGTWRNLFLTESVGALRWHMSVLWPGPIALSDIVLIEKGVRPIPNDSEKLNEGYGLQKFLDGEIEVLYVCA